MKVLKLAIFFIKIVLVVAFVIVLTRFPGQLTFHWFGYQVDMGVDVFLMLLIGGIGLLAIGIALWKWSWSLPLRMMERLRRQRLAKAEKLWLDSLLAFAAGELEESQALSEKSDRLNDQFPMATILGAQAAYAQGYDQKAYTLFLKLSQDGRTQFFGLRGLVMLAQKHGQHQKAYELLQKAYEVRPTSPWVMKNLLQWDLRHSVLGESAILVERLMASDDLNRAEGIRLQAIIAWKKAIKAQKEQDYDRYYEAIHEALGLAPDLSPAVFSLAAYYDESKRTHQAIKVLTKGYKALPLPRYVDFCARIFQGTSLQIYQQVEALVSSHPTHPVSLLILGTFAARAHLWGKARQHLTEYRQQSAQSQWYCQVMALLETEEFPLQPERAEQWIDLSLIYPKEPVWQCRHCDAAHDDWDVFCLTCGELDTLSPYAERPSKTLHKSSVGLLAG